MKTFIVNFVKGKCPECRRMHYAFSFKNTDMCLCKKCGTLVVMNA